VNQPSNGCSFAQMRSKTFSAIVWSGFWALGTPINERFHRKLTQTVIPEDPQSPPATCADSACQQVGDVGSRGYLTAANIPADAG